MTGSLLDWISAVLLVAGSLLSLLAGIGLLRFPNLLSRVHAGAKPQVLGVVLMAVAAGLQLGWAPGLGILFLTVAFQFLGAPVSAHMVGRAAHRTGQVPDDSLEVDDLAERSPDDSEPEDARLRNS